MVHRPGVALQRRAEGVQVVKREEAKAGCPRGRGGRAEKDFVLGQRAVQKLGGEAECRGGDGWWEGGRGDVEFLGSFFESRREELVLFVLERDGVDEADTEI